MALPRDPRQKMINFMYLVLTAMLALNVSSEILNAFKVVDNSLIKSNGVVDQSNKTIQSSLNDLLADPGNKANAAIWKPKADSAVAITNQMSQYIESLKDSLKREAGFNPEKGDTSFKDDDLDAATRLFSNHGQGEKLKTALGKYRDDVLSVLPAQDRAAILKDLPIDINPVKSGNAAGELDWTTGYFHMTPTVAALTMLSKFQNDVKRSGNLVASHCLEQVGKVVLRMDKFVAFAGQNSQYLMPGQPFELTAGLGAFSSENTPKVSVNGANVPVDANGVATFKETAGGGGQKRFNVVISYVNPNTGKTETTNKEISYTVGQPSGAAYVLTKMNVVYIGVDNPLTISGGSAGMEKTSVSFSGGGLSGSGGSYNIKPGAGAIGEQKLNISVEGKTTSFPIRVKRLPPPSPFVGSYTGGPVPTAAFRAMGGVRAQLVGSDFAANYSIQGYTIGGTVNGQYTEQAVSGAQWGGNPVIANAKPGNLIGIFNIRAVGPDGSPVKLTEMAFRLQ